MKNIRLRIEFDGTDFSGYQIQNDRRTVQGVMEDTLFSVLGESIRVRGCSRTDAGVHARGYVMNFMTDTTIPPEKILYPLNNALPDDIRVLKSEEVPMYFDSREDAQWKIYTYTFLNSDVEPVIDRRTLPLEKGNLDFVKMQEGTSLFIGTHDFRGFMSQGTEVSSTVRTIYSLDLSKNGDVITTTVRGDGFLYNMVRIIAGTLIYLGQGTRTLEDVRAAIEEGDRTRSGKVAQAKGLTLTEVGYDRKNPPVENSRS